MSTDTAFFPTPPSVADFLATSVFGVDRPTSEDTVLYWSRRRCSDKDEE